MPPPIRSCVGCRQRLAQRLLARFVQREGAWVPDVERHRAAGRGAYLCSQQCALRVAKNKRFAGLAHAAAALEWG